MAALKHGTNERATAADRLHSAPAVLGGAAVLWASLATAHAQPFFVTPAKHVHVDQTRRDAYYADPAEPNVAGVWRVARDTYRMHKLADIMVNAGEKPGTPGDDGLPPGVLPRGVWIVDGHPLPGHDPGGPWIGIPYRPAWAAVYARRAHDNYAGRVYGDPHFDCLPRGAVASYETAPSAFTVTQTPGRIQQIFYQEQIGLHTIYTDGRPHAAWSDPDSADYDPTPYGDSIGHWEGRTLVIDTRGIDRAYTLGNLAPHSTRLQVVERWTRIDDQFLDIVEDVTDPVALAKPMRMYFRFALQVGQDFKEETCSNNRNATDVNGYVQTLTHPKRSAGWDLPDE